MPQFTVTLSDAEAKALSVVTSDSQGWIDNVVHERCRVSMDNIIAVEVERKIALGESISGSREDIVLSAPVETAAEMEARIAQEFAAKQGA